LAVPRHTVKSNSPNLFLSLVATGRFIAVLPASILHFKGKRLGLKALPFEFPIRPDPVCNATLRGRTLNPATEVFIDYLRELAKPLAKARR
jgi:DNA-binding transcriptional LysR family regulator